MKPLIGMAIAALLSSCWSVKLQNAPQTDAGASEATKPCPCPKDASTGDVGAPGGIYAQVCRHLAALGCAEGSAANCIAVLTSVEQGRIADLKPACLLAAQTPAGVQSCGTVACQ